MKVIFVFLLSVFFLQAEAQNIVMDVHSHNIIPSYFEFLLKKNASMDEDFPLPSWNVEEHLRMMDDVGIDCSVLSMPAPQPYFGDSKECQSVIRGYNVETAAIKDKYPDRFRFCASLPLPDVEAAIREAIYALDTLNADGIKLATNSRGLYLGDESLDTLMSVLNGRSAVVFIHPHKPVPVNDSILRTVPLAVYEYPAETTRALMNMIARNVPQRYPNIKFIIPHCGSFLPLAIARMKNVQPIMQRAGMMQPIDWAGNLRNLYYDLAGGLTPDVLSTLLSITQPSHLLYGSDYPYVNADGVKKTMDVLRTVLDTIPEYSSLANKIFSENANLLFNKNMSAISSSEKQSLNYQDMLVRISEIEIYPEYKDEYLSFSIRVGEESVKKEPGVIAIFPMIQQNDSCQVRILEIYANQDAYKHHIDTNHFKTYKQGTLHMVKSLDLVDMYSMNPQVMPIIFRKIVP